jgi:hypothetical protein
MDDRYPLAQLSPAVQDRPAIERAPAPGQQALALAALMLALVLMGIQLWLLTVALELYLAGSGRQIWLLVLISGLIFLGGLLTLRVLARRPPAPGR